MLFLILMLKKINMRIKNGKIKVYISDNGDPSQAKLQDEVEANY